MSPKTGGPRNRCSDVAGSVVPKKAWSTTTTKPVIPVSVSGSLVLIVSVGGHAVFAADAELAAADI